MKMPATVSGYRPVSYTNKENKPVQGVEVCLSHELLNGPDVVGHFSRAFFLRQDVFKGAPSLGACTIEVMMRGDKLALVGLEFGGSK